MHRFCTAVLLLVLGWTACALAQVKGEVESIGFSSYYRPECWTPMVVRLRPESGETGTYQIHVVQEDLDRDRVIYARTVTLTGNTEGQGVREQRYWMYFIPQATELQGIRGLPDPSDGLARLQERLKVFVTNADGSKQISQLPLTTTVTKVDGYRATWTDGRGTKIILVVSDPDSGSQALSSDYRTPETILGLQENVAMIPVAPADLPEDPRGYDAIDAILLLHVDPANLKLPTDERMRAIRQYVATGGRLVICQLPEADRMSGYGDLLPVRFPQYGEGEEAIQGNYQSNNLGPLRALARAQEDPTWNRLSGPIRLGVAEARTNAVVDEWINWGQTPPLPRRTPYIARSIYGTGSVTWVAQDLGEPLVVRSARTGWAHVWDRVFDWKQEPLVVTAATPKEDVEPYASAAAVELGKPLVTGMDHGQKGATMVFVAVVFFVAYWVLAGPVAYVVLLKQDRARLSWFVFGASAFAATLVTALVVKIALSGAAEVRHTTVVRSGQATPAVADARIGLYIPKDGPQRIAVKQTVTDFVSHITPFPIHPQFATGNEYPAYLEYRVPVRDATAEAPPSVEIPFRRTLKKVQAHWVGITNAAIEGSAELRPADEGYISGTITNVTGHELANVYIAFKFPVAEGVVQDWVMYVPKLARGGTIDLGQEWKGSQFLPPDVASVELLGRPVRGIIGQAGRELQWDGYWHRLLRSTGSAVGGENNYMVLSRSFPMISLFERIPPAKLTSEHKSRFEIMRRGARRHDLSHCLAAGGLIVIAQADEVPLPFPFEVEGDAVAGRGTTFYQAVIPLKRSLADAAALAETEVSAN